MMVYIIIFDSTTKMAADISLRFNCYVYTLRQHTHTNVDTVRDINDENRKGW